uniref:Odorant receptor n=1 Tax=Conogethes pinicolalis TaxID=1178461 RepID=A0A5B9GDC3_9NEOP|nr:odorant receptor 30 [Conogethes pinicolalis]
MATFNSENLFLNRAKFMMNFLGVWVPPVHESTLHKLYKMFMLSMQYSFLIFQTIHIVQIWGDLAAVSQPSYLLFTQACLCLKITIFHVNVDNVRELLKCMQSDVFLPRSVTHEKILQRDAAKIKSLLLVFMIGSQLTCGLWIMVPLFEGVRKFPFAMWMPVYADSSPQYEIGYVYQYLTICTSAIIYFGVDSVALSMIIFGCSQIEIIMDKILSISSIDYNLSLDKRQELASENRKKLVECVTQYQAIVTFTKLVEDTYHWYLLFQLTGGVGLNCMSALRILADDTQGMQIISIVSYLSVMLCQLYICCWCGDELSANSENLHTVLYMCIWHEQDVRFKKDLCFVMMRMSRPLVLRAGHYISMSRQTFVAVMRMSYSYFAVLNQTK